MVMHASKLPRLSDGFHDRNEAHPYQTSVDKYPSKSLNTGGTNSDHGSSRERDRDKSQLHPQHREMPASGMRHSASPHWGSRPSSESGSPRTYRNKSTYLQRQRDRQQRGSSTSPAENTFNHQAHQGSNQTHQGSNSHPSDPQSSHERHIKTILAKASEWSEHISSSKKKYYYNCKTEVSQWEKPKEWIERERLQRVVNANEKLSAKDSPKPVQTADSSQAKSSNEKHSSDSSRDRPTSHQHHSQSQHSSSDRHQHESHSVSSRQQHDYYSGSRQHDRPSNTSSSGNKSSTTTSSSSSSSSTGNNNNSGGHGHPRSTPSRSTPTSTSTPTQSPYGRSQYHHQQHYPHSDGGHGNRTEHEGNKDLRSPGSGPSPSHGGSGGLQIMGGSSLSLATDMYGRLKSLVPQVPNHPSSKNEKLDSPRVQGTPSPGPVTASPLNVTPKTHIHHNQHSHSLHPPSSAQRLFQSSHSPSLDHKNASSQHQNQGSHPLVQQGDKTDGAHERLSNQSPMSIESVSDLSSPAPSHPEPSPKAQMSTPVSQQQQSSSSQTQQQHTQPSLATSVSQATQNAVAVATVSTQGEGTRQDDQQQQSKNVDEDSRPPQASPTSSRKSLSPTHSVSSQSGQVTTPHKSPAAIAAALASAPLKPITATISPSLIQFYDENITRHTINWPADHVERQAQRFGEESHTLGAEYSSQISVDLKFARSLVRASEIQATLQEQRILFLRQQAKDLEKLKSENAYVT
ncbi:LOW QUALITY PROTEIN: WW domain-containing adapter protein with coiled-coil-like [Amphiura filiformis]|uniref:LOW QUALITY PROTEIN: WW domain-containing adapter protein with coiled-coil-like n=1 Tax=Amphiura filiformis TaxID=82378 RepID=UPI003B22379F